MNRFTAAAVAVAAGTLAVAADKPKSIPMPTPAAPPVVTLPLPPAVAAECLRAEQDAYLRRMDVCAKLRDVAGEKNDTSLARRADELEKMASALYHDRVAKLGITPPAGVAAKPDPKPMPAAPAGPSSALVREVKP